MKQQRNYNPVSFDNLQMFGDMDADAHRALSARGGIASGISRRQRRELRENIEAYMMVQCMGEEALDDLKQFRRWRKRRDAMRKKRERSTNKA
jgi:hypothetical protein